jgi:hypothetical protein
MMLLHQIENETKMGGMDRYEVMQLRKMVEKVLFKWVKVITTTATEKNVCSILLTNQTFYQKHSMIGVLPMPTVMWCTF